MGGANGSRERAPDDRLRDTHHRAAPAVMTMMGFAALYPSYGHRYGAIQNKTGAEDVGNSTSTTPVRHVSGLNP
jgi:hypothetical protein